MISNKLFMSQTKKSYQSLGCEISLPRKEGRMFEQYSSLLETFINKIFLITHFIQYEFGQYLQLLRGAITTSMPPILTTSEFSPHMKSAQSNSGATTSIRDGSSSNGLLDLAIYPLSFSSGFFTMERRYLAMPIGWRRLATSLPLGFLHISYLCLSLSMQSTESCSLRLVLPLTM
ncbi:hypothetical protein FGO68_gene4105 [Halteria grandinella]|uniref:Uncharacterized protein n=1 Tax=Halteria grandinella TaxID=5974 RepID=A0A8J8N9M2_HALGN|nr:hypothetical protein FGO68_gene4105 [Halteria grandinella]